MIIYQKQKGKCHNRDLNLSCLLKGSMLLNESSQKASKAVYEKKKYFVNCKIIAVS